MFDSMSIREAPCAAVRIVAHVVLEHPEQSACLRHRFQWVHAWRSGYHRRNAVHSCFRSGRMLNRRCAGIEDARTVHTLPWRIGRTSWHCRNDRACSVNGPVLGMRENVVDEQTLEIGAMRGPSTSETPRRCQRQHARSCSVRTTNSISASYSRRSPEDASPGLPRSDETIMENIAARGWVILRKPVRQLGFSEHCHQAKQQIIDSHFIVPMLRLQTEHQRD